MYNCLSCHGMSNAKLCNKADCQAQNKCKSPLKVFALLRKVHKYHDGIPKIIGLTSTNNNRFEDKEYTKTFGNYVMVQRTEEGEWYTTSGYAGLLDEYKSCLLNESINHVYTELDIDEYLLETIS